MQQTVYRRVLFCLAVGIVCSALSVLTTALANAGIAWKQLPAASKAELSQENIDQKTYDAIIAGEIVVQDRPIADGLSGVHVAAVTIIEAETKAIWDVLADCQLQTTFMPDFAECRPIASAVTLPPNERLAYNRFTSRVMLFKLNFEFVVHYRYEAPKQMWWHQVEGDMKVNQGYWRLIHLGGLHHVVILDSTVDPGVVPEFIQRIVTKGNIPKSVRALREYVDNHRPDSKADSGQ